MRILLTFLAFFCTSHLIAQAQPTAAQLPDQPALATVDDYGNRTLTYWSAAEVAVPQMKERLVPDNPAFKGAEVWLISVNEQDAKSAAMTAYRQAGMQGVRVVASTLCNPSAMKVLDAHPEAAAHVVMVTGELRGVSALGIALVVYGTDSQTGAMISSVHSFVAPEQVFIALGGYAIPAVRWLQASASPDEDMRVDGALPPQQAVDRLGLFFAVWVEDYVIPMIAMSAQMQMQSIQNMQSWNNAMNSCNGDPGCTVTLSTDGSGNWEAHRLP